MSDLMTWAECMDFTFGEPDAVIAEEAAHMRKITPTQKTVLRQQGVVQLVKLERFDCAKEFYGVTFPRKVGHLDGLPICEQFMTEAEAVRAYDRYVKFFESRRSK